MTADFLAEPGMPEWPMAPPNYSLAHFIKIGSIVVATYPLRHVLNPRGTKWM
jgi:hypothetical protein